MEKGMGFCTWYVRSLYMSGPLSKLARELVRYKVDLMGVQEVKYYKLGTVRAGEFIFFSMEKENHQLVTGLFVHHRIVTPVNRVDFVSDTMSYIDLRGRWFNSLF
jgi:hypothetical protein